METDFRKKESNDLDLRDLKMFGLQDQIKDMFEF